jgi:hypothetical protein
LRRVRAGEHDGRPAWSFDVVVNLRNAGHSEMVADNYSAAVVTLPWRVDGRVGLARRGLLRTPQKLDAPVVEVGTDALRRRYRVMTPNPDVARALLSEPVCEWLAGPGRGFHYEIVHQRVLAYGWRRYLGGSGPRRAAAGLAGVLAAAA